MTHTLNTPPRSLEQMRDELAAELMDRIDRMAEGRYFEKQWLSEHLARLRAVEAEIAARNGGAP